MRHHIKLCIAGAVLCATAAFAQDAPVHPWVIPSPQREPSARFTNLKDGDTVNSPFVARFGLSMRGIVPAGKSAGSAGHHHLLIDQSLPLDFKKPLPFTEHYVHFGKGQMETVLNLKPGTYKMTLLLADQGHIPYFVYSKPVNITVAKQSATPPADVLGPKRIEVLEPANGATVKAPLRVVFHASGYNISHIEPKVPDTGHFRLTMEGRGKPEVLDFIEGQTEAWINPPPGTYAMKLELVDNVAGTVKETAKPMRVAIEASRGH